MKTFVLDTNVLLHDPRAIFKFDTHEVVIPIYVIEEIDRFKRDMNELGRNARTVSRQIDELRKQAPTTLQNGVSLPQGGTLRIAVPTVDPEGNADQRILAVALQEQRQNSNHQTVLVSMDTNVRLRADALKLRAENYDAGRLRNENLYTGFIQHQCSQETVDLLGKKHSVHRDALDIPDLYPNACVFLTDEANPKHTALGRFDGNTGHVVPLRVPRDGTSGIKARNLEQHIALDLLLNDKIQIVTLVGRAGTGKTLIALAAGLKKVISDGSYARLLVSRPIFPMGRDVGYLPGTLEEKLNPWMQPIFDNLEYIFRGGLPSTGRTYAELLAAGTIQVEPLTYIRGRSLPQQLMIIDEAQNLTLHETKTIITRCGADTKIILTGDPDQIDNPYVDSQSNGLTQVAERFKGEQIAGHVMLVKGERSELAQLASQLL